LNNEIKNRTNMLKKALSEKGDMVDYVVVEGADHGDIYWVQKPIIDKVVSWFKENTGK
jgi:hypothetical protein